MQEPIFYFDVIAIGILCSCQYYMIKTSFSAWKHVNDSIFGSCVKRFISWVGVGTIAGAWLLFSHIVLR